MGCCAKKWSHDTDHAFFIMATKAPRRHTKFSSKEAQTEKGFSFPSPCSFSLSLSLSFPLHVRFITSFILLPHLTIFSSCCCNFVLWSIYIFLHCTCVHSNVLSWWTTITIVSNSFLLLLLVLRYMKFSRSNLRQVVDSRSVHESKNKTTVYVKWIQIVHNNVHLVITQYLIYVSWWLVVRKVS